MKLDFGMDAFFYLLYTVITYKEIRVSPKRALLSGIPSQILDLENFAKGGQQNSPTVEFVGDTYDGRRVIASILFWICSTTCSYSCAAVDKISIDRAQRKVRLR